VLVYGSSLANRGGTGVYLSRLIDGLARIGATWVRVATADGIFAPGDLPGDVRRGWLGKLLAEQISIPALLRSSDPDLVHLPAFGGRPPGGTPFTVTLHDLAFMEHPGWFPPVRAGYYAMHFPRVARRARTVMVDSDFTGSEAVRILGVQSERIRRVYLSTPDFTSPPDAFRNAFPGAGERYLLYTGTVEPRKNVESLLDAWGILRNSLQDHVLVLAGRWGWGMRSLRRRLEEEPRVLWTGSLDAGLLKSAVSGARLLVYPSLYEGFGLPPLEAASAGVPSVLGPADALREVYGGIAAAFCGASPGSIAEAVLKALGSAPDPGTLRSFAARFTDTSMAEAVTAVYRESIG
jgi:alpha-1,3-rhamnosyl/mannosyltransferase